MFQCIDGAKINDKIVKNEFVFVTLVTSQKEYDEHLKSLIDNGFNSENCSFVFFNNQDGNNHDPFESFNHILNHIHANYVIFVHQDTRFNFDKFEQLQNKLDELSKIDPNWAVAGNAGGSYDLQKKFIRITDPANKNLKTSLLPHKVNTLDENFLILKKESLVAFSNDLSGFHFYGTDLCQQAEMRGYNCYAIDFHLKHLSSGNKDYRYYQARNRFIEKYQSKLATRFLRMTTGRICLSGSYLFSKLFNNKHILFFLRKSRIYKFISKS